MLIKQKLSHIKNKFNQLALPLRILIGVVSLIVLIGVLMCLIDKRVEFSYAGDTCTEAVTLLPGISRPANDSGFTVTNKQVFKIGNFSVVSFESCFAATKPPLAGVTKVSVAPFGGWFAKRTFALVVPDAPVADTVILSKPIPTARMLPITLSSADATFDYSLVANDKTADCPQKDLVLQCDIPSLGLLQGEKYSLQLIRSFHNQKVATVATENITTLVATSIVSQSVSDGQVVYDTPKSFSFTFDKPITKADVTLFKLDGATQTPVPTTTDITGNTATISLQNDLDRSSTYELDVNNLLASDGSTLTQESKTDFTVSGGPGVTAVNVGTISVPQTKTIAISFDQSLLANQDITKLVTVTGVSATISKNDSQILVTLTNAPLCTDFTINLAAGLQSEHGIPQVNAWSFTSRTICHTVSTIGYSVEGRAILAYTFGSGSKTILYTGSIHGSELSANALMLAWIDELETNARSIPSGTQIVVVPAVNPDGVAADRRNNSNNVDLNRNFDTSDWQTDIVSPTNQPIPGGGGATPMSEPETQAIAALTTSLMPRLTMSFHSQAGYAIANQGGDSDALAATYAQMTGYQDMTGNGGAFDYSITGTYDDWIREKLGLPSVLVELSDNTHSEFSRNKAALWAMAKS